MPVNHRARRLAAAALSVVVALALGACAQEYPNTTFTPHTEFGRDIDALWDTLLLWGTIVFVVVEVALLFTIIRFRHRPGTPEPKQVHGNTALEIAWTLAPAAILILIAIPTVRTIFRTQAEAIPNALQVEVIGHQWWWEFRYPQYGFTTANELYLPVGRTVNFSLESADVLHSFWIPQLGGKRDLISNRTNYLWFTPDSTLESSAWNGFCAEYCGDSHANMKFRVFTVQPAEFESWVKLQQSPAAMPGTGAPSAATLPAPVADTAAGDAGADSATTAAAAALTGDTVRAQLAAGVTPDTTAPTYASAIPDTISSAAAPAGYTFPAERMERHAVPATPIPEGLELSVPPESGDAARGRQIYSSNACIACHMIEGNPNSQGVIGPNLTHVGSRRTIGAGLYPNDPRHLALWIKNSQKMKPGSIMPPQGQGEVDSRTGAAGALTDQQIADIAAYLSALR
ncbi:MAG: cytochrome c oxidase subunit II [Gemmatimonadaceae bacterium]